jgi:alpha-1,2-mannosyltransferase
MASTTDLLRSGDWLTRERVRLVALAVLAASAAAVVVLLATSDGLNDFQGRPLGTDFANIYAAGSLALDGRAAAAFDVVQHFAREKAIFGPHTQIYSWHYPPFFLLIAAALALLPYGLALLVWQAATFALYLTVVRAILRQTVPTGAARLDPLWLLLTIAFPAVFVNLGHGHNGFLTAALLGGALLLLDRRPLVAGVLFGLLAYKPQFALMIPLVLVATGRWRVIAGAAAAVAALALVTTLALGIDIWRAFLASTHFTRAVVLEQGGPGWHKLQSVFAWVRMWGGAIPLAYALQGAVTLALGAALVWLWRSPASFALKAAALCLATLLAPPYSLDYDTVALAPAIAFLIGDRMARGFATWDKTALALLWFMPAVARSVTQLTLVPLGTIVMLVAFVFILRRATDEIGLPARWQSAAKPLN